MKYFNKRFFKFTLGFLLVVVISLILMAAVSAYAAGVAQINFTTDEQVIAPNEISGPITIQSQDGNGDALQTPETIDLEFISSSPTGEFLNSAGNAVTTYMSKNTANRTFYYRDTNVGSFIINVKAVGRESGKTWQANQNITVSNDSAAQVLSANTNSLNVAADTYTGSVISGPANVSNASVSASLEITAGPDRLTTPGSPITFQAAIKKNTGGKSPEFTWSFGDGHTGAGDIVTHMFKYPGQYAVVLNARAGDAFAVSRIKVLVIKPDIVLSEGDGYVEVINQSGAELNLFNWKITRGHQSFIFQPDTIVFPNSSIKIEDSMLRITSSENAGLVLKNFMGDVVVSMPMAQNIPIDKINLTEIIPESFYASQSQTAQVQAISEDLSPEVLGVSTTTEEIIAPDNIIYEAPKPTSFLAKIWTFFASMLP